MDFGGREGEVPVARHCFGRRERDVAVVEGGEAEGDVPPQDDDGEPEGQDGGVGERDGADGHEGFVGHGVDDGAEDGLRVQPAREVAVQAVGEPAVGEEGQRGDGLGRDD